MTTVSQDTKELFEEFLEDCYKTLPDESIKEQLYLAWLDGYVRCQQQHAVALGVEVEQ